MPGDYQLLRRVPESAGASYLARRLVPLIPAFVGSFGASLSAKLVPEQSPWHTVANERAEQKSTRAVDRMQDIFFSEPGLDTVLVREITRAGKLIGELARIRLWIYISLGRDRTGLARRNLQRIPRVAYDSAMLSGLAIGKALGYFTGGDVHTHTWFDSGGETSPLPGGHPLPQVRRFGPPSSLGDLAADIDDLYWADAYGQGIKVTLVGDGDERRWMVSIPGTDHPDPASTPNAADLEANMREELNIPSAMRVGVVGGIHQAMALAGVPAAQHQQEKVLLCGHSQGGIIAAALAAADPVEVGFHVTGALTMGTPGRRYRIRDDVTMIAVEHLQDAVPAMDGTPRKEGDHRVVVQRPLTKPRVGSLYYAHASSTYTDTVRLLERRVSVSRWGKTADAVSKLQEFLPRDGESTRVFHQYIWQDVLPSHTSTTWNEYLEFNRHHWEPVTYGDEVSLRADPVPTPQEVLAEVGEVLESTVQKAKQAVIPSGS